MTTLVESILEIIVKSSVILGLTFLATLALRRQSAALRHTVWTAGLLSALALPILSLMLPAWHVEPIRVVQSSPIIFVAQPSISEPDPVLVPTQPSAVPSTPSRFTPERILTLLWMLGALSVALLLVREAVRLARVAFGSIPVRESPWQELAHDISHALLLKRHVRLMRNPDASVLGTWGTLRPQVILPRESESWSSDRMRAVLGHEFAHVKRNDWLVQVIAEGARAICWFNPLFWIACTQLRRESEHACDDAAMNLGSRFGMDGPAYAAHVLDLARTLNHAGAPVSAALAMASTSNLERRLIAMLNPSLNRRITGKGTVVIIALIALGLTLPLAAMSSRLPVPVGSMPLAVAFAPQTPATVVPAVLATRPPVQLVQRTLPQSVAVIASASPSTVVQTSTGTISGTVFDRTGAAIPGVRVYLTAPSGGQVQRILSNDSGKFTFADVAPGNYSLTADLPGFRTVKFSSILASPGSNTQLNVTMQVGPVSTMVNISAQAPPGLRCFIIYRLGTEEMIERVRFEEDRALKAANGTPSSEADCPGGSILQPARPSVPGPIEPNAANDMIVVDSSPVAGTQPALQPNGRPYPIRVGGDVQAGNLLSHPSPAYPVEARNNGIGGTVTLAGIIAEDGRLRSLKIIDSDNPLLEASVLETLQNWTYAPTLLNRQPIEITTTITVHFILTR